MGHIDRPGVNGLHLSTKNTVPLSKPLILHIFKIYRFLLIPYVSGTLLAKWDANVPLLFSKWDARSPSMHPPLGFAMLAMFIAERCLNARIWAF